MKSGFMTFLNQHGDRPSYLLQHVQKDETGTVKRAVLFQEDGYWYPVLDGVPRMVRSSLRKAYPELEAEYDLRHIDGTVPTVADEAQRKTNATFSYKWNRFNSFALDGETNDKQLKWTIARMHDVLDGGDETALCRFLSTRSAILEVGCGSGYMSEFMATHTDGVAIAVDINDSLPPIAERVRGIENLHVVQADLMDIPVEDETFDYIHADGVLHHTPNTKAAMLALIRKCKRGGTFWSYIYKEMNPVKHFCDDYIRNSYNRLTPDEAFEACKGITELGRALCGLDAKITLEKPIPILNIPAGTFDVQRLLYYNFLKCFWNDAFDYDTNVMVNYDWFHPYNAFQHTIPEVDSWLQPLVESGEIRGFSFYVDNPNGLNVVIRR